MIEPIVDSYRRARTELNRIRYWRQLEAFLLDSLPIHSPLTPEQYVLRMMGFNHFWIADEQTNGGLRLAYAANKDRSLPVRAEHHLIIPWKYFD